MNTESLSREDLYDDRAKVTAQIQSIIFYNYIAYKGAIYVRGGIPIYAQWLDGHHRHVVVVSSGVDRSVIRHKDLRFGPPLFGRSETQRALREGRFWTPENEFDMRASLTRSQPSCPYIHDVLHELTSPGVTEQIQLDALFREVLRLLRWLLQFVGTSVPYGETPDPDRLRSFQRSLSSRLLRKSIIRMFDGAVEPKADDYTTTKLRLDALRSLFRAERRIPKRHASVVEPLGRAFEMLDLQMAAEVLTEEDAAALNSICS